MYYIIQWLDNYTNYLVQLLSTIFYNRILYSILLKIKNYEKINPYPCPLPSC